MAPAEYRARAAGLVIRDGFHPTSFGEYLLSLTDRGICGLTFQPAVERVAALAQGHTAWPGAALQPNEEETIAVAAQLFAPTAKGSRNPGPLLLHTVRALSQFTD